MVKKIRRMRSFVRSAPKSQEKQLIENAKQLLKDPFQILPECNNDCINFFAKTRKKIEKIAKFADDSDKLEKTSNKKGLEAALAGTLLLAHAEKAPYLGVIKLPIGDIPYAQRGKAEREKLIAVQHFNNPILRLMGIKDIAYKKHLYIYSWDGGFFCSGRKPQPPTEFVTFIIKQLNLQHNQQIISCKHLTPKTVIDKASVNHSYLRIQWPSANKTFAICSDCVKPNKNTIFTLSKYMLTPDLIQDFIINVIPNMVTSETLPQSAYLNDYISGKITDAEFITKNVDELTDNLIQSEEKIFMFNGKSFGTNAEAFIQALKPTESEQKALQILLNKINEPIIISDITPNKLLEKYWKNYGKDIVDSLIDDQSMTNSFYHLDETPSTIIQMIEEFNTRQQILSTLPNFQSLPPLAKFADTISRTYKTFGKKKALNELKNPPKNLKARAVAFGFLQVFNKGDEYKWKYSKEEIEYGDFLQPYIKSLIEAEPEKYRNALQELLTISGSNEKLP